MGVGVARRWRFYRSKSGRCPVREFLDSLSDPDAAAVLNEMRHVAKSGLTEARHLRGDIYELRADGEHQTFRVLVATEGRRHQILLALHGFSKKSQQTPPRLIALAEARLADWRARARP